MAAAPMVIQQGGRELSRLQGTEEQAGERGIAKQMSRDGDDARGHDECEVAGVEFPEGSFECLSHTHNDSVGELIRLPVVDHENNSTTTAPATFWIPGAWIVSIQAVLHPTAGVRDNAGS